MKATAFSVSLARTRLQARSESATETGSVDRSQGARIHAKDQVQNQIFA